MTSNFFQHVHDQPSFKAGQTRHFMSHFSMRSSHGEIQISEPESTLLVLTTYSTTHINFSPSNRDSPSDTAQYYTRIKDRHPWQNFLGVKSCGRDYLCTFTKPPLPKRVGSLAAALLISWSGGGSPDLMVLVVWKVPVEGSMGAANCFH